MHGNTATLGNILVLIGTILFAIAIFFGYRGEPRGRFWGTSSLVAIGGFLIGLGILIGAPALVTVS